MMVERGLTIPEAGLLIHPNSQPLPLKQLRTKAGGGYKGINFQASYSTRSMEVSWNRASRYNPDGGPSPVKTWGSYSARAHGYIPSFAAAMADHCEAVQLQVPDTVEVPLSMSDEARRMAALLDVTLPLPGVRLSRAEVLTLARGVAAAVERSNKRRKRAAS